MCKLSRPSIQAAPQILASPQNIEGTRQADIEARLRRARSSAAASILTSPTGISAARTMGEVGQ